MKISFISKTNQVYKLNTKLDQCRHYLLHLKQSTGLIGLFKREIGLVVLAKFNFLSKKNSSQYTLPRISQRKEEKQ